MKEKPFDFDYERVHRILEEVLHVLLQHLPEARRVATSLFDTIFAPNVVVRQLALAMVLETGAVTAKEIVHAARAVSSRFSSRSRLTRQLERRQRSAATQDEWMEIAEQIDTIQGDDIWRSEDNCQLYESDRLSSRIDEFVHLMRRRDVFELMFTLRGGITRNKFGLLHEGLFTKALAGTKVLVETYHNVICASLDFVCDAPVLPGEAPIPTEARLAFFNEARHAYGRTALLLSGGAALGFYHTGVVKALIKNGLMPRVLSGSSAGSIVCSMIGTRTNEECIRDLFNVQGTDAPGHYGRLKLDFFRPLSRSSSVELAAGGFRDRKRLSQLFVPAALRRFTSFVLDVITGRSRPRDILMSDTEHFRTCCRINIGNFTFQEAFDRTGRILNITVSPQNRSDPPRLLNYLTAPHIVVWSAAVASSSLPGVFESNRLIVKDPDGSERYESDAGVRFLDGSMEADLPMQQLSEMFNINHFIISQANPHALMFSSLGKNRSVWTGHLIGSFHGMLVFLKNQVKAWMKHAVELIGGRRVAPLWDTRRGFLTQFFTQEYVGRDVDITLNPWGGDRSLFSSFLYLLYNPSEEEFKKWTDAAERETWRQIPRLKSHCAVEMTLDKCVQRLRKRLVIESWEAKQIARTTSESTQEKMNKRVPSFFVSPSLVNLGGLSVGDQSSIQDWGGGSGDSGFQNGVAMQNGGDYNPEALPLSHHHVELSPGWGGMGLRGNHSSTSLARTPSAGSGLFVMDTDDEESKEGVEHTAGIMRKHSSLHDMKPRRDNEEGVGYIKTTSMANFYYRNSKSHDNLFGQMSVRNSS